MGATADCDALLMAVRARLKLSVGGPVGATSRRHADDSAHLVRASVLECVTDLDRLRDALRAEFELHGQLQREVRGVHAALANARTELAGTRAGERRARHLASHDSLTSLPNRDSFRERLDQALAREEPRKALLAVLYLDLDGFKEINDSHGHDAGDELLRIVAARLGGAVRAGDVVSRLGGDEFACLLADGMDRKRLILLARKLFDIVSAPSRIGPLTICVRPSIGIATCPGDGTNADELLRSADFAMYLAKRRRSGHAFFDQGAASRSA
ncbi:MAG: GGDEF domain-containing protein [Burkholderiaceae bacterium]|nr:GGDEF domain-containing protein [Burkholderiaceae bacterium]